MARNGRRGAAANGVPSGSIATTSICRRSFRNKPKSRKSQGSLYCNPPPPDYAWLAILLAGPDGCDRKISSAWRECGLDGCSYEAWQHASRLDEAWRAVRDRIGGAA